jgi:hypothetical protein
VTSPYTPTDTLHATTEIPDDGEAPDAAEWGVGMEQLADGVNYVARRIPSVGSYSIDGSTSFSSFSTGSFVSPNSGGTFDIEECEVGDLILCDAFFQTELQTPASTIARFRLIASDDVDGTPTAETQVPGAMVRVLPDGGTSGSQWPTSLGGVWTVTAAGTTRITIQGTTDSDLVYIIQPLSMRGLRVRPA